MRKFNALTAQKNYGSVMTQFKGEFANAKAVLLHACQYRLAEEREKLSEALERERAHLETYGAAKGYDANESQPVRRQASRVSWLEKIEKRIESEPVEQTWTHFAREFLK